MKQNKKGLIYPPQPLQTEDYMGVYPIDFLLETVLKGGLEWFRSDESAPMAVFGWLSSSWLAPKYGKAKIDEIAAYIRKYEVKIVHHWSMIPAQAPCISLQLLDAVEETSRAAMDNHMSVVDVKNDSSVMERTQIGYAPIVDNMHIGIHTMETPDLAKYLYYLVVYILNSMRPQFEERGLELTTFRATDLSRLNEYLPENVFSRYINFTAFTVMGYEKASMPMIEKILGVHLAEDGDNVGGIKAGLVPKGNAYGLDKN